MEMRRALRALARADALELTEYAMPLGHPMLRQRLCRRLADIGIEASAEQILLTESGTQAIDLICRFLLEPGDTVLVDDPLPPFRRGRGWRLAHSAFFPGLQ